MWWLVKAWFSCCAAHFCHSSSKSTNLKTGSLSVSEGKFSVSVWRFWRWWIHVLSVREHSEVLREHQNLFHYSQKRLLTLIYEAFSAPVWTPTPSLSFAPGVPSPFWFRMLIVFSEHDCVPLTWRETSFTVTIQIKVMDQVMSTSHFSAATCGFWHLHADSIVLIDWLIFMVLVKWTQTAPSLFVFVNVDSSAVTIIWGRLL